VLIASAFEQLSSFAAKYMASMQIASGASLTASDLVCLGYFLCGLGTGDVAAVSPSEYKYAFASAIVSCTQFSNNSHSCKK
jgi:hypothetical protein